MISMVLQPQGRVPSKNEPLSKAQGPAPAWGEFSHSPHPRAKSSRYGAPAVERPTVKTMGGAFLSWEHQHCPVALCTSAHLLEMPLDTRTRGESRLAHIRVFANSPSLHSWLLYDWNAHLKLYLRSRIP